MGIEKAFIEPERGAKLTCLFNPSEIQLTKSNAWGFGPSKGKSAPDLIFDGGRPGSLTMELMFDTTHDGTPVTKHTDALLKLMDVDESLPSFNRSSNTGRPPWVTFHWGQIHSFKAIIESLDVTFTYFSSDGIPLRARAQVSLRQYETASKWGRQNPTSGTPTPHRVHHVSPGETLDRIAAKYYDNPGTWRDIAVANQIVDPLGLVPGTPLTIPEQEPADG